MRLFRIGNVVPLCFWLCFFAVARSTAQSYKVDDLGAGNPSAITNSGQVVVWRMEKSQIDPKIYAQRGEEGAEIGFAYLWDKGVWHRFPSIPGATSTYITAANQKGVYAGGYFDSSEVRHAYLWQDGKAHDLNNPPGLKGFVCAVNDSGTVVGYTQNSSFMQRPCLWNNGILKDLGLPEGATGGQATDINRNGEIVGTVGVGKYRANQIFRYVNGQMQILDIPVAWKSQIRINASGQISGDLFIDRRTRRPFVWRNGKTEELGSLGGDFSIIYGQNESGQVVGAAAIAEKNKEGDAITHAFVFHDGKLQDLNKLVPAGTLTLNIARSINDSGQIVCAAKMGAKDHTLLLTPIFGKPSAER